MPIPGEGQEKKLGKIRAELTDGLDYNSGPISDEQTSLNAAEGGEYGTINEASDNAPNPGNPSSVSEWDNYD